MTVSRLTTKLGLALILLVGVSLAANTLLAARLLRQTVAFRMTKHRVHLGTYLAAELVRQLPDDQLADSSVEDFVTRLAAGVGVTVTLRDAYGRVVSNDGERPLDLDPGDIAACGELGFSARSSPLLNYPSEITVPLQRRDRIIGFLQIGYPAAMYDVSFGSIGLQFLLLGLGTAAAAVFIAIGLTRPLKVLSGSIRRISSGDLDHRASISSRDEFGELARSFNEMTAKLGAMLRGQREFLAGLSHELRSPLARMRLTAQLVRDATTDPSVVGRLDALEQDVEEVDRTIEQLLTASRLDLSQEPLPMGVVELRTVLREALSREEDMARSRGIELRIDDDANAPATVIRANRDLLVCAVGNLLNNAVMYSPDGSIVRLRWYVVARSVRIEVEDRGMGVATDDLPRLFEPFFRADRSRSRKTGGVGLGLMLVRRIVERHRGQIRVISESGAGTTITIELPLELEPLPDFTRP